MSARPRRRGGAAAAAAATPDTAGGASSGRAKGPVPIPLADHPLVGHHAARALVRRGIARAPEPTTPERASDPGAAAPGPGTPLGRLPGVLLVSAPRGHGATRFAIWLGMALLCAGQVGGSGPAGDPCGACWHCQRARSLSHPDLHWYAPSPALGGGSSEQQREAYAAWRAEVTAAWRADAHHLLPHGPRYPMAAAGAIRAAMSVRPSVAARQVLVIDRAEALSTAEGDATEAAAVLLKALEAPGDRTTVVLVSGRPDRVPDALRSRAVRLVLGQLAAHEVCEALGGTARPPDGPGRGGVTGALEDRSAEGQTADRRARVLLAAPTAPDRQWAGWRLVQEMGALRGDGAREAARALVARYVEYVADALALSSGAPGPDLRAVVDPAALAPATAAAWARRLHRALAADQELAASASVPGVIEQLTRA